MSRAAALMMATAVALGVAGPPSASVVTIRRRSSDELQPVFDPPMPARHHGWPGRGHGTRSRKSARLRRGSRSMRRAAKRANRRRS